MKNVLLILLTATLVTSCIDTKEPEGLGISVKKLGKISGFALKECHKKNCVNSQKEITGEKQFIEPIKIIATKEIAFEKIMKIILKEQDMNIVNSTSNYIRAKQVLYGKLVTDIEFFFGQNKKVQMRAEMRGVPYDLGNSRRVLESIRFKFHQNDY